MLPLGDTGTLAPLCGRLTNDAAGDAWNSFIAAINQLPGGVTSDDPFGVPANWTPNFL